MQTQTETQTQSEIADVVRRKTVDLCEAIVQEPQFQNIRQRVDQFMSNPAAQSQYEKLSEKGRALHEKQHSGAQLTPREVAEFDSEREALFANPVAKGFLDAQEQMHELQQSVSQLVTKTFELGRVPSESDLEEGSCGHGCGCHH